MRGPGVVSKFAKVAPKDGASSPDFQWRFWFVWEKIVKTQHFAGVRANTPEGRAHAGKFKRMPLLFNTFGKTILTILSDFAPTI